MGDILYIYFDDPQYLKHAGGLVFFFGYRLFSPNGRPKIIKKD